MVDKLNLQNGIPLYRQLVDTIRTAIQCGELSEDAKIPTESELSRMYDISRITVRNAIEELVEEGLLIKRQGKGTYVAPSRMQRHMKRFMGFTESCEAAGREASTKVLELSVRPITQKQAHFLQLDESEKVIYLRRVRCADGKPVMIEANSFPTRYNFLLNEPLEGSLYAALRKNGVYPAHGRRMVSICYASKEEAELLDVPEETALLLMTDYVRDAGSNPLHITKQVIRSDLYELVIDT